MKEDRWTGRRTESLADVRPRLPSLSSLLAPNAEPRLDQRSQSASKPSIAEDGMKKLRPSLSPEVGHDRQIKMPDQDNFISPNGPQPQAASTTPGQQAQYTLSSSLDKRDNRHSFAEYGNQGLSRPYATGARYAESPSHRQATLHSSATPSMDTFSLHPAQRSLVDGTGKRAVLRHVVVGPSERLPSQRATEESMLDERYQNRSEPRDPPPRPPLSTTRHFHSDAAAIPRQGTQWSRSSHDWQEGLGRDSLFNGLLDIFLVARRYNHAPPQDGSTSFSSAQVIPPVRQGDVPTLRQYLEYELDKLDRSNPRMADHLTMESRGLLDRFASFAEQAPVEVDYNRYRTHPQVASSSLGRAGEDVSDGRDSHRHYASQNAEPYGHDRSGGLPSAPYGNQGRPYATTSVRASESDHLDTFSIHGRSPSTSSQNVYATPQGSTYFGVGGPYAHAHYVAAAPLPKRVRKRRDEIDQVCLSCSASETPEWRKGPTGPRTLCNACGLLFAKQCRKRGSILQMQGRKVKGVRLHGPERMTNEERESSLLELQLAVQARSNQAQSLGVSSNAAAPSSSLTSAFHRPTAREVDGGRAE